MDSEEGKITRAILTEDGRVMIEQPDGSYILAEDKTDDARLDAMSDEEIHAAAVSDPDALPTDAAFWENAKQISWNKK